MTHGLDWAGLDGWDGWAAWVGWMDGWMGWVGRTTLRNEAVNMKVARRTDASGTWRKTTDDALYILQQGYRPT
jgi:hypothetical protein